MLSQSFGFSRLKSRTVSADFSGGHITDNAGLLLLRQADRQLGLSQRIAECFQDYRDPTRIQHSIQAMIQQRLLGLAAGYEDLIDHNELRFDPALRTAAESTSALASAPTLHRLETSVMNRDSLVALHHQLWQNFVESHTRPPKTVVLDFDATDVPVHGDQPHKFFHGYYDHYCYLPLYVFAGRFPLVAYLRPSNVDGAHHSAAILRLLVAFLRQHWPDVQIIFRGDSGFCRQSMLRFCERYRVDYIVGIARNPRLQARTQEFMDILSDLQGLYQQKAELEGGDAPSVREFWHFTYQAKSWDRSRKVIAKMEVTPKGPNPRFLLTTLDGDDAELYCKTYCARGDMENRIKDQQLDLFAKRCSSKHWYTNQWRLLLSTFAWLLFEHIRKQLPDHSPFKFMGVENLRLKLIKIGAVVIENTRRIHFYLNEAYPYKDIFRRLSQALV